MGPLDEGGGAGPLVEQLAHSLSDAVGVGPGPAGRAGRTREFPQVGLGVRFQEQGAREADEDLFRRVCVAALFEAQVVLDADAGEQRDLLTAQSGHAPPGPPGQADVPGAYACTAGAQIGAEGGGGGHMSSVGAPRAAPGRGGCPCRYQERDDAGARPRGQRAADSGQR